MLTLLDLYRVESQNTWLVRIGVDMEDGWAVFFKVKQMPTTPPSPSLPRYLPKSNESTCLAEDTHICS